MSTRLGPNVAFEEREEEHILAHQNEKKSSVRLDMLRERLSGAKDKAEQSVFGFSARSAGLSAMNYYEKSAATHRVEHWLWF